MKRLRNVVCGLLCAVMLVFAPSAYADMQGVDVSSWQPIDISRMVEADFAIVKVTQGTGYVNPNWQGQSSGASDTGKKLGLYHYAGGGDPTAEADYFLSNAGGYVGRALLALDWEANQNAAWGNGAWVRTFVNRVHDRTGVWPLVYVQASAIGQIPQDVWDDCGLWVAQYANKYPTGYQSSPWNAGLYGEAMRQYASTGRLPGYSGNLDLNVFWGDAWQWDAYANPKGAHKPSGGTSKPSASGGSSQSCTPSMCVTVRAGDSLSRIAALYGGSWADWSGYRSGNPNLIYPGETVCRNGGGSTVFGTRVHIVKAGECLSVLFPSNWRSVAAANGIANPNLIHPGQAIRY